MKAPKSWREKLATSNGLPKLLLIPAPLQVDEMMRRVPRGKLATTAEVRQALARENKANAAGEAAAAGEKNTTPYWRTLKPGGQLNPKYPGGVAAQKKRLAAEGHKVVKKGKAFVVADYEKALFAFPA